MRPYETKWSGGNAEKERGEIRKEGRKNGTTKQLWYVLQCTVLFTGSTDLHQIQRYPSKIRIDKFQSFGEILNLFLITLLWISKKYMHTIYRFLQISNGLRTVRFKWKGEFYDFWKDFSCFCY